MIQSIHTFISEFYLNNNHLKDIETNTFIQ